MSRRHDRARAAKVARRRHRLEQRGRPTSGGFVDLDFSEYWDEAADHLATVIDRPALIDLFERTLYGPDDPPVPFELVGHMAGCERCQAEDAWGLGPWDE